MSFLAKNFTAHNQVSVAFKGNPTVGKLAVQTIVKSGSWSAGNIILYGTLKNSTPEQADYFALLTMDGSPVFNSIDEIYTQYIVVADNDFNGTDVDFIVELKSNAV